MELLPERLPLVVPLVLLVLVPLPLEEEELELPEGLVLMMAELAASIRKRRMDPMMIDFLILILNKTHTTQIKIER
jgi:hypothetical protein